MKAKIIVFTLFCVLRLSFCQTGWYLLNHSAQGDFREVFFLNVNTGFVCGQNGTILKTTNGGNDWTLVNYNTNQSLHSIRFIDDNTGFSVGNAGLILKTTNSGSTWFTQNSGTGNLLFRIRFIGSNLSIISGSGLFLKSTNGGDNWSVIPTQSLLSMRGLFLVNQNVAYSCGAYDAIWGKILKTTNGGDSWDSLSFGFTNGLYGIYFINANTGYVTGGIILKTTNGGASWINQNRPLTGPQDIQFLGMDTCFVAGSPDYQYTYGVSFSTNAGQTWFGQYTPIFDRLNSIHMLNSSTGYVAGENAKILKSTNSGITQINTHNIIPSSSKLYQNYPNPFNPTTTIKLDLHNSSFTSVSIYDISGKMITLLINKNLNAGTYEVKWDGAYYPSGVYFYKIYTNKFVETRKMILLK